MRWRQVNAEQQSLKRHLPSAHVCPRFHHVSPSLFRAKDVQKKYRRLRASPVSATAKRQLLAKLTCETQASRSPQPEDYPIDAIIYYMDVTNFSIAAMFEFCRLYKLHASSPARCAPGFSHEIKPKKIAMMHTTSKYKVFGS